MIPLFEQTQIFMQHIGQPIAICEPGLKEPIFSYMEGIDASMHQIITERINYPYSWIKLIKKPISAITDKDARIILNLWNISSPHPAHIVKLAIANFSKTFMDTQHILSQLGYAMPITILNEKQEAITYTPEELHDIYLIQ